MECWMCRASACHRGHVLPRRIAQSANPEIQNLEPLPSLVIIRFLGLMSRWMDPLGMRCHKHVQQIDPQSPALQPAEGVPRTGAPASAAIALNQLHYQATQEPSFGYVIVVDSHSPGMPTVLAT